MSKVIMFSRKFPSYHPNKNDRTYFVEKILKSLGKDLSYVGVRGNQEWTQHYHLCKLNQDLPMFMVTEFCESMNNRFWLGDDAVKYHTVRGGHRFKKGDSFSPRVWSGDPYKSKQIIIGNDIEVKSVFNFTVDENGACALNDIYTNEFQEGEIANNDGLTMKEFSEWIIMPCFRKGKKFDGQIICWDGSINYFNN